MQLRTLVTLSSLGIFIIWSAGCSSSPSGPVAITAVKSPQAEVVVHPGLGSKVGVPNDAQRADVTPAGLLRYSFQLQNRTERPMQLSVRATFFEGSGVTSVDDQAATVVFLDPFEIESVVKTCTNAEGERVKIQIAPLR